MRSNLTRRLRLSCIASFAGFAMPSAQADNGFVYPIEHRASADFVVVEKSVQQGADQFLFACAVSAATGKAQRAQTIVNVALSLRGELTDDTRAMMVYLAPHAALCEESRVTGVGHYVPTGQGWPAISRGEWTWLIRTSNAGVDDAQIEATKLYNQLKPQFKREHGMWDYSDKLDAHVTEALGREPTYVTAGMWNDDFVKE